MKAELAGPAVGQIGFETKRDAVEGQVLPGDFRFGKKRGFEAFNACGKVGVEHSAAIKEMDLADVRDVDHRKKRVDFHLGAGFFECFALGRFDRGFTVFHEAGGECPAAVTWFDGPAAEQDFALPFGDATDDDLRVFVVDGFAARANVSWQGVAGRDAEFDRRAALLAEVHGLIIEKAVDYNVHKEHNVKPTSYMFFIAHPIGEP